jgi:hypothetical protein
MLLLSKANSTEENLIEKVAVSQLVNNVPLLFFTISGCPFSCFIISPPICIHHQIIPVSFPYPVTLSFVSLTTSDLQPGFPSDSLPTSKRYALIL